MTKCLYILIIHLVQSLYLQGQWSGTNPEWTYSNVGIGINNPSQKLEISSTGDVYSKIVSVDYNKSGIIFQRGTSADAYPDFKIYTYGGLLNLASYSSGAEKVSLTINNYNNNIGIGTSDPQSRLHIVGTDEHSIRFYRYSGSCKEWGIGSDNGGTYFHNITENVIPLYIGNGNGNIGIGTTTPGAYKLNVHGMIRANEVVVNTSGADFVFEPDYNLPSLFEIEKFITKNKRLPEIPSAKEMQENGMNMSDMQTKLLQKIEELTLYIIELKKENTLQNEELDRLRKSMKTNLK